MVASGAGKRIVALGAALFHTMKTTLAYEVWVNIRPVWSREASDSMPDAFVHAFPMGMEEIAPGPRPLVPSHRRWWAIMSSLPICRWTSAGCWSESSTVAPIARSVRDSLKSDQHDD